VAGTVPSRKNLVDGTVPSSKNLLDGTVPSCKNLVDGTVPSSKNFVNGTFKKIREWGGRGRRGRDGAGGRRGGGEELSPAYVGPCARVACEVELSLVRALPQHTILP
jgi:hypothetical protein